MNFGLPWMFVLLVALVPVVAALVLLARWRRAAARRLVRGASVTATGRVRRVTKAMLLLGALALLVVGAARPQWGSKRMLLPREGTDVMVVLDVSASMLANDVEPNRFERTKVILSDLIGRLQGDRVGLTVFAGNAALRFPLTVDMAAARELVRSAAIREGSLQAGTGVGDSIRVAVASFPPEEQTRSKVILLVTDGEDLAGSPLDAVRAARDRDIVIHTMGIGTEGGGAILVPRPGGTPERRIDPTTGQPAVSRLDEGILRQIASAGRGRYFDGNGTDPAAAVADEIGRLARTKFESQEGTLPIERYQWFVVAGLVLLLAEFLLPDSRGVRRRSWPWQRRTESQPRSVGRGGEAA